MIQGNSPDIMPRLSCNALLRLLLAALVIASLSSPRVARSEMQWTGATLPGPWPTAVSACFNGEVEPRIEALRAANPSIQYRWRTISVNEYLPQEESRCNYVIERQVAFVWVTQEIGPRTHLQTGSIDPCPQAATDNTGYCAPKNAGPPTCPTNESNPIDSATGNKYQFENDYMGGGTYPLQFVRHYNSLSRETGVLGRSWRHHYQRAIVVTALTGDAPTQAKLYREDGKRYDFTLVGGIWRPDADIAYQLQRVSGTPGGWRITTDQDDVELYDAVGRLRSITLRSGQRHTLTYATGRLSSVSDSEGRALTFSYDGSNRLTAVVTPAGQNIAFTYDANNRLSTVTYPDSASRLYHYNESSLTSGANLPWALTGITDESSTRFASFGYDALGRAVSSQHAGGAGLVSIAYGANGTRTVTDALGTTRTFSYTTLLNTLRNTGISHACDGCGGAAESLSHDVNGNVVASTDFNGNVTTYTYDLARNLQTSRTEASGTPLARTITTNWHSTFRLPTQIDEPGRRTTFTYDANGNQLTRTVTDLSNSASRTWTYTYDALGKVISENGPRTDVSDITTFTYYNCTSGTQCGQVNTVTNALGQVTTYTAYNEHGQPLTAIDPNGLLTTFTYDHRQRLLSETIGGETASFSYYATGLTQRITLPDASFIQHFHDAAQRLTRIEDAQGNHIAFTLDAKGNTVVESVFDPANVLTRTRSFVYNSLNRLQHEVGAAGTSAVTTTLAYDGNGNVTGISAPLNRTTENRYDVLGRLSQITDANAGIIAYTYNALDQLISVEDPRNLITTYEYNAFNDLTVQVSPDTGITASTYDAAGNLITRTDARGSTATYVHDALHRPTQRIYSDQTVSYTYDTGTDQLGRLTAVNDASGSTSWTYDAHGRVLSRQQTMGTVTKNVGYSHDSAGRLAALTLPSGHVINYGYDILGRIDSLTLNATTPILSDSVYEPMGSVSGWTWGNATLAVRQYDTDGNIIAIDSAGLVTYDHDAAFRVTSAIDSMDSDLSQSYQYDLLDRLISATGPVLNQQWSHDASGNRLSQDGAQPATYTVDNLSNRLHGISGALTRTYTHDAAGNSLTDGIRSLTHDGAGRLVSVTQGGVTTAYALNAIGQRVSKTLSGIATYFVYDELGHLIGEYDSAGHLIRETIWLEDTPVAVLTPNGAGVNVHYIHTDHLDTPRRISRPSDNAVVWRWDADPFGTAAAEEDPDNDGTPFTYNLRFPGQYHDQETGLHYNYFRDYDPSAGRYVQSDPIGLDGGINTYAYVAGAPTLFIDPDGLRCTPRTRAILQLAVNITCKWSGDRRCTALDDCATNQSKISRNSRCIQARTIINTRCFNGGDAGHKRAVEEAKNALQNCNRLRARCCAGDNCD